MSASLLLGFEHFGTGGLVESFISLLSQKSKVFLCN